MAGCVLRAKKEGFNSKEFLSTSNLDRATQFQGGFNLTISKSDDFKTQIKEVERFLINNRETLENLVSILSPDAPELNFGLWRNSTPVQSVSFPLSLIAQCSDLGIELCASIYEVNDV